MKHLGKRVLATILAFGITASMLVTDMSTMQVYAAGNTEYVEEVTSVEPANDISEEVSVEAEVESSASEQEMEESVEPDSSEEAQTEEEETIPEATTEEVTEEVPEETVADEMSTEMTEAATEELTEETTYTGETDIGMEGVESEIYPMAASNVNKGFTLSADEDGRLVVEFEDGINEVSGNVEIPKEVKIIPAGIFTNKIFVDTITFETDSELVTIEKEAFFGSSVASISLPKSLQAIEDRAFYSADLKKLVFEAGGEQVAIGELAFAKNYNLEKVITNGRLKAIDDSAFLDDRKIDETIELSGVEVIGAKAFYGCESLDYIVIPDSLEVIEESTFENCKALGKHDMAFYRGVNAVQFGTGVTEIKDAAFKGCSGLQELILPANVEKLGQNTFGGCTSLKNVKIYNVSGNDATNACDIELTYTSFPSLKGLVLEAYDGKVEDWVGNHTEHGVEFKSLYKSFEIEIAKLENGTIVANKSKAKMGATVTVTVTPEKGYVLEYGSLYYAYKDAPTVPIKPINTWDYSFEMPEKAIVIYATFVKEDSLEYGTTLTLSKDDLYNKTNESISYSEEEKILSFTKPWQNVRIEVKGKNGKTPLCSQLVFSSSNTNAVTIDEKGNIRAIAPTTNTKITVAFEDENNKTKPLTFTVKVGSKTYVSDITLDYTADKAEIDTVLNGTGEAAEAEYDIITYPASILKVKSRTIKITPEGRDSEGDTLDVPYKLSSNDTGIAKPKGTTFVGAGTITIPKGAKGETVVTIQANEGSKNPVKRQFIVRIIDDTPRLVKSTIKVDPQSTVGTFVDMVSVYGGTPNVGNLAVYKKVVRKGNTVYESVDEFFKLNIVDGKIYLKALENEDKKYDVGKEYKYANTYFIGGTLEGTMTEFYVPIPTLIVRKKDIKPTVKMSGKINLFYNGTASIEKTGKVTVKQSQKDLVIEECYLLGKEKTNGVNMDDDSAFTDNFTVDFDKVKQTIRIIRTPDDEKLSCYTAGKSKGKPVLSGKIRIKYEGYTEPFDIKITVPTETVKPSYKLSISQIKLNSLASGQEYEVAFKNKKTNKVEDLLLDETIIDLDKSDSGTTDGLIEEDEPGFGFDAEKDTVSLKIVKPKNGKIVLILRQPEWEDQSEWNKKSIVKATINVSASSKYPKAVFDKSTLSLNASCPDASDYTVMKLNQTDAELLETQTFEATGSRISEYLSVNYDSDTGRVIAEIDEGATVKEGTYSFTCTPKFRFKTNNGNSALVREAAKVTVKVKVKDAVPYIKLKKTSFTLNSNCNKVNDEDKYDYVTTGYSWSNLPAEYSDYTLSDADKDISYTGKGIDYIGAEWVQFEVDENTRTVKIYVNAPEKVVGSSSYKVEGLKLIKDDIEIPIKPISFKIKCVDKTPGVSVTAKGTINPLDSSTQIVYTPKLSNINGTVVDVELRELAENGSLLAVEDAHFEAEHNTETGKTIVKVKEPEVDPDTGEVVSSVQLEKRTYRIQLYYVLSNGNGESKRVPGTYQVAKDQKITPKQTMPKLTVDKKSATFFAGDKSRTQTITVTKKSTNAEISNIKFSTKTPLTLRNAFIIDSFNSESGEMVLRLKNSAFIKQNTEQTLTFEIECDGQLKNTTGTTFTVKVKVIK